MKNKLISILTMACLWAVCLPVATVATISTTGCSSGTAIGFVNAFIDSAQAIVAADPNAPYVVDLDNAISDIKLAEANWNGSSLNCALMSAASIAVKIIDGIDPASAVALIATVAVAGFDALSAALFPCTTPAAPALTANVAKGPTSSLRTTATYTPTKTALAKAWFPGHTYRGKFNEAAKQSGLRVRI